ncbi:hypothetical protein TWF281_003820 [Arthrobotrys megalospora]
MHLVIILFLFVTRIWSHETNIILTDPLSSVTCDAPAFRFFQNTTLVLNEPIPTDSDYSTCSWHDDIITAVEMCGATGLPYQCALYTDNTCGNGDTDHANETATDTIIPDISNVYKIVFSDPSNQWLKVSWDDEDQMQIIKSFHCIPSTSSASEVFSIDDNANGKASGKGSNATETVDVVSETGTATNTPSESSTTKMEWLARALCGAVSVLMVLYI